MLMFVAFVRTTLSPMLEYNNIMLGYQQYKIKTYVQKATMEMPMPECRRNAM